MAIEHIIKKGEDLTKIGKMYGKTAEEIAKENGITNINLIYEGDVLRIPDGTASNKPTNTTYPTSSPFEYDDFQVDGGKEDGEYNTANSNKTAAQEKFDAIRDFKNTSYYDEITKTEDGNLMLDKIIQDILNRKDFSYDLNGDALYQQYKDKYIQQGKLAMQDTMGQASAMTGGYGSSYASTAGNQAYQAQLQNLNDIVPELYQMAYDRYNQEGQDMYNQYALLSDEYDSKYGMYMDEYNKLYGEREYWGNEENNIYNRQHDEWSDDKAYAYQDHRDAILDAQKQAEFEEGVRQYEANLAETQRQFNESHKASVLGTSGGKKNDVVDDDTPQWKYVSDEITDAFKTGLPTISEFNKHQGGMSIGGVKYTTYKAYVAAQIYQLVEKGDLDINQAYSLMADYGIETE